ncbi:MAG: hypothetical protein GY937_11360 [bacterium]|nr:hypothetical protein [bacterium]
MARSKRMSVQKRLREKKKAEAAALKREMRAQQRSAPPVEDDTPRSEVADREALEGYGVIVEPEEDAADA